MLKSMAKDLNMQSQKVQCAKHFASKSIYGAKIEKN